MNIKEYFENNDIVPEDANDTAFLEEDIRPIEIIDADEKNFSSDAKFMDITEIEELEEIKSDDVESSDLKDTKDKYKSQKKYKKKTMRTREYSISINNPLNDYLNEYVANGGKFATLVTELLEHHFNID